MQTIEDVQYVVCGGVQKDPGECYALTQRHGTKREEDFHEELDYVSFYRRDYILEDVTFNGDGRFSADLNDAACVQSDRGKMQCGPKGTVRDMRRHVS